MTTSLSRRQLLRLGVASGVGAGCGGLGLSKDGGPPRVVSTSPSTTETVFAVGRGAWLVGRSSFCDHPPEAASVAVIGGFADPNLEKVLALRPTLVCGERGPAGPDFVAALERHGIATSFPPIDRVADVSAAIEALAKKLDASERGLEITRSIHARIEEIGARIEGRAAVRAVMLFDWKPLVAAGPESFPAEIITLAGGTNAVKSGGKYPKIGVEGLLTLDPDLLIDGSAGAYPEPPDVLAKSIPGMEALRAVKTGRVLRLEGTSALRSGPRIAEGIAQVAKLMYPDIEGALGGTP